MAGTDTDQASAEAQDRRNTGPGTVADQADGAAGGHLGPSGRVGQPRGPAEDAAEPLEDAPPETKPSGR